MNQLEIERERMRQGSLVLAGIPILLGALAIALGLSRAGQLSPILGVLTSIEMGTGLCLGLGGMGVAFRAAEKTRQAGTLAWILLSLAAVGVLTRALPVLDSTSPLIPAAVMIPVLPLLGMGLMEIFPDSADRRAAFRAGCGSAMIAFSATVYLWGAFPREEVTALDALIHLPALAGLGIVALGAGVALLGWRDANPVLRSRLAVLPFAAFIAMINLMALTQILMPR
jgi:hypothetical protein